MSAFIVDKSHINAMLQGAISVNMRYRSTHKWYHNGEWHELTHDNASDIGQMLLEENIKSVSARYPESPLTDLPGRIDCEYVIPFEWHVMGRIPKPIELIKITNCYAYQSCEHDDWKTSEAKAFCDALIDTTIGALPGYDDAPWEWHEDLPQSKVTRIV